MNIHKDSRGIRIPKTNTASPILSPNPSPSLPIPNHPILPNPSRVRGNRNPAGSRYHANHHENRP